MQITMVRLAENNVLYLLFQRTVRRQRYLQGNQAPINMTFIANQIDSHKQSERRTHTPDPLAPYLQIHRRRAARLRGNIHAVLCHHIQAQEQSPPALLLLGGRPPVRAVEDVLGPVLRAWVDRE